MPQIARESGGVIGYYPSKTDAMNDTNYLAGGFSHTIGEMLGGESIGNYTEWKIYSYVYLVDETTQYLVNSDTVYTNGMTLPTYDGNGTADANRLGYTLYAANECCTDSTQAIGLPYETRNDITAGIILTQMPPPQFTSYDDYYKRVKAKSTRK